MPFPSMTEENLRYSREDLAEFDKIIQEKLTAARKELSFIKETLTRNNESGTDTTAASLKVLEDGAETAEKESLNQLASRQMKFIQQLENAQLRIKNGTYGVCIGTGKLIPKERLRAVPHTQHSIEANMARRDEATPRFPARTRGWRFGGQLAGPGFFIKLWRARCFLLVQY
jgi:DnaK suppressor protein